MYKEEFIKMIVNGDVDDTEEFWENVYDLIKKEHCNEPNCPECNLVAYEKGKQDTLQAVKEMVEEQKEHNKILDNKLYIPKDTLELVKISKAIGRNQALEDIKVKLDELISK